MKEVKDRDLKKKYEYIYKQCTFQAISNDQMLITYRVFERSSEPPGNSLKLNRTIFGFIF